MLLEVRDVYRDFVVERGVFKRAHSVRALDGISFSVQEGSCHGIAGESGSGKTTLARIALKLLAPTAGTVVWDKRLITHFRRDVQIVFQNPYTSLNPRMRVYQILREPLLVHKLARRDELPGRVRDLIRRVGLDEGCLSRYPDEFSGGQRQRICIARALSTNPRCLILDEPVSSLDLTVQAQMLDLFRRLRQELRLTYIFISHNLAVLSRICDTVMIMRHGRIVENASARAVFDRPQHAYTRELLAAAGKKRFLNSNAGGWHQ